jgi:uncharacterized protein YbjT (DUF2867 family)
LDPNMRIAVLGATGNTGRHVLDLALGHGNDVTALVRSPGKLTPRERLSVVQADLFDPASLAAGLAGHDAVISVFGPPSRDALKPGSLVTDYTRGLIAGMRRAGVDRLAIISAAVLFPMRGPVFAFFRWLLRHHARDLAVMEHLVQDSPLTWTIARPGRLRAGDDASYRTATNAYPPKGRAMSFRAVAGFLVETVERGSRLREIVGLAR